LTSWPMAEASNLVCYTFTTTTLQDNLQDIRRLVPTKMKFAVLPSCLCLLAGFSSGLLAPGRPSRISTLAKVSRYGPPDAFIENSESNREVERTMQKTKFRMLLSESMVIRDPEHLPRLLANNIELIFSLRGHEGVEVISELVEEAKAEGPEHFQRTVETVETILTFAEDFVNEATQMDSQNKKMLGKIIKTMTSKENTDRDKEELLDQLMEDEKENFTPGFLRHLDGECARIANAPKMTPESARLLEIIRIIQTRVLEELGKGLGEAAIVLGQLMGYEKEEELRGVLDAGLTVRGRDFALEMSALTSEALDSFKKVRGGVDPGLVERVGYIESILNEFLDDGRATP
jgi:hypothetical protein